MGKNRKTFAEWTQNAFEVFLAPKSTRKQIIEALGDTLNQTAYYRKNAILLVAQIDEFETFNRQHSGDEISEFLSILELRMKGGIFQRDMVRQLDSGQFAVVLSPLFGRSAEDVLILAGQVQDLLSLPVKTDRLRARVTVSIGCALARSEKLTSGAAMLEAARIAQMEATASGPCSIRFYVAALGQQVNERRRLISDIPTALKNGEIIPYFQPQISLSTGKLSGVEVLARWQHVEEGLIPPGVFLPLLEEAGLMRDLGQRMLSDALAALQNWDAAGLDVPQISINMCAEELAHPDIYEDVKAQLRKFGISPARLVIEVLETVSVSDPSDPITRNLARLSDHGCHIDLDDFGTGHASIKSLHNFTVNRIKIDRSYISNVDHDLEQQQVVSTILLVAKHMNVDTLAEGVETLAEIEHLTTSGCGHAQGYIIAKPLPEDQVAGWFYSYFQAPSEQMLRYTVH